MTRITSPRGQRRDYHTSSYRSADNVRLTTGSSPGPHPGHALAGIQVIKRTTQVCRSCRTLHLGRASQLGDRLQIGVEADEEALLLTGPASRIRLDGVRRLDRVCDATFFKLSATATRRLADYRAAIGTSESAAQQAGVEKETRYASGIRYLFGGSLAMNCSVHTPNEQRSLIRARSTASAALWSQPAF